MAANFISAHEGLRLRVYICPGGYSTIGYGHLIKKGESYNEITICTAYSLLLQDTEIAFKAMKKNVHAHINIFQQIALTSFVFNLGERKFATSTLLSELNQSNYINAADEFLRWTRAGGRVLHGLVKRRNDERDLFLQEIY